MQTRDEEADPGDVVTHPFVVDAGFGVEDLEVGPEPDAGAGTTVRYRLDLGQLRSRLEVARRQVVAGNALVEHQSPRGAVAVDLGHELAGQGVDHGRSDPMQAAGRTIGSRSKLAAGVEFGEHHLESGATIGLLVHRDTPAVVGDLDGAVLVQRNLDVRGEPSGCFVDRVVDDLPDEVVQAIGSGPADVHAGSFTDRVEALEDLDLGGVVVRR